MLEELKAALKKSHDRLEALVDKLEDECEDLSDDTVELWQKTKPKLNQMKASVSSATHSLHQHTDEARVQVHLATLDAHDQWQHLSKTVTALARHAARKGSTELQYEDLQAHLAAMDARDFANIKGKVIRKDFNEAKDRLEKASHAAAEQLETSLEKLGDIWAKSL